jgi:hypothetical protein
MGMTVVNYWSHIPHVRIEDEVVEFGPGHLWRVPFEVWDHLMLGAFSDHREAYESTAAVCFYMETDVEWDIFVGGPVDHTANIEAKKPAFSGDDVFEQVGLGFMTSFVSQHATSAQAALTLARPMVAPGSPRMSVTMFKADDAQISIGDMQGTGARMQGDADHEWMLMPESAGEPLDPVTLADGSTLYDFAWAIRDHDDLRPALDTLLRAAQPTLNARQRLVLCTIALEALLMPEARSDLAATFHKRVATLLDPMPGAEAAARVLYQARSAALHGDEPRSPAAVEDHAQRCVAQQVLAAAILALGPAVLQGHDLEELRSQLDGGSVPDHRIQMPAHDLAAAPTATGWVRLEHDAPSSVVAVMAPGGSNMRADEGEYVAWCPLVGLRSEGLLVSASGTFSVDTLLGGDLMELEERDIRRDFMAQVAGDPSGMPVHAVIGLLGVGDADLDDLRRRRRDAVLALRLAGFARFVDPSLLGWYVFEGPLRTRIPTVLRQSVIQQAGHPAPEVVSTADQDAVAMLAALVEDYRDRSADVDVDALLDEFLVAHPNDFLPGETSAALMLATIESAFGRFRPRSAPVQLEDLVAVVSDGDAAQWFATEGRAFRNAVAHGRWVGSNEPRTVDAENLILTSIARSLLLDLLHFATSERDDDDLIVGYRAHVESRAA